MLSDSNDSLLSINLHLGIRKDSIAYEDLLQNVYLALTVTTNISRCYVYPLHLIFSHLPPHSDFPSTCILGPSPSYLHFKVSPNISKHGKSNHIESIPAFEPPTSHLVQQQRIRTKNGHKQSDAQKFSACKLPLLIPSLPNIFSAATLASCLTSFKVYRHPVLIDCAIHDILYSSTVLLTGTKYSSYFKSIAKQSITYSSLSDSKYSLLSINLRLDTRIKEGWQHS